MTTSQSGSSRPTTPKADLLIVDDTPNNLSLLSQTLTEEGYKVRSVVNGPMALTVAQAAQPDLILLDIRMPGMDGYEVCQRLKAVAQTRDIPVIFLSALDEVIDKIRAFEAGGVDYITKPFQSQEVLARVENQLRLRAAEAEVRQLNTELERRVLQRTAQLEQEIMQRQQAQDQLLHMALHDPLTDLPNRALFTERLGQVLNRAKQHPHYRFAVMFLDCDRFKGVNDSLGHSVGDQLLIAVARRLETLLVPGDTLARLGGDEFAILLENIQGIEGAIQTAEGLQQEMTAPFHPAQHEVFISISIGIVLGANAYAKPEHLLRDADTAMYQAKRRGKACHQVFKADMHKHALTRLQLGTDLRRALERQEFTVHYQPIVDLRPGKIVEFEALLRWHHPKRGWIAPDQFIPEAEETGLIVPLGLWIMRTACHQLQRWHNRGLGQGDEDPRLKISVNLSVKQFSQPDLIEQIDQILHDTGLQGSQLKLEVTESAIIDNDEVAIALFEQLKRRQIHLTIDDFGTGYSSLSYLYRFPVDTLKIDRSFINALDQGTKNIEIVQTILDLATNLGIETTAEGVETAGQLARLKTLNCQYGQGNFFSRPLDSQSAGDVLESNPQW